VTVRRATADDLTAITLVRTSVRENHLSVAQMGERGITAERIIRELSSGVLGGWVAEEERRIVAFSMAYCDDGQIFALFTLPGFERKGWGSRLLDEALQWLKSNGHSEAWLSTGRNTVAQRFYERRGWRIAGDDPDDHEDVMLRKAI
jgi:GNAT superfamily N-acetyltransferase